MAIADDRSALIGLLERYRGWANGRRAVDVARELVEEIRLPKELIPVLKGVARLQEAERALEAARSEQEAAATALAELVEVRRRDKDTAFEAQFSAERIIVGALLEALGEREAARG